MTHPTDALSLEATVEQLRAAVADLWYPSETDAPVEVVVWAGDRPADLPLDSLLEEGAGPIERLPAEAFFRPVLGNPFWRSPQGNHLAQRYETLQHWLSTTLSDLQTYRVGAGDLEIYLIGRHPDGQYVGLKTSAVET